MQICRYCNAKVGNIDSLCCSTCIVWQHSDFEKIGRNEEPCFCLGCRKENLPFLTLDTQKFSKLFEISKSTKNKVIEDVQWCRICDKKNYHVHSSIKCTYSKHIIYKKCSKIQNAHNFVCATCLTENSHRLKILILKNCHLTPILLAAAYKRTATAIDMN